MRRSVALALVLPFLASATACSLAAPSHQAVNVMPSHPRAEVYVDGNLVGRGAQTVQLKKSSSHSVMAKCGESAGAATIDNSLSTTGVLDIVGGFFFLVPFIGLVAPGAWTLSPTTISVAVPDSAACEGAPAAAAARGRDQRV